MSPSVCSTSGPPLSPGSSLTRMLGRARPDIREVSCHTNSHPAPRLAFYLLCGVVCGVAAGRSERGGLHTAAMGAEQQVGGVGRHGPGQRHQRLKLCKYKLVRLEVGQISIVQPLETNITCTISSLRPSRLVQMVCEMLQGN